MQEIDSFIIEAYEFCQVSNVGNTLICYRPRVGSNRNVVEAFHSTEDNNRPNKVKKRREKVICCESDNDKSKSQKITDNNDLWADDIDESYLANIDEIYNDVIPSPIPSHVKLDDNVNVQESIYGEKEDVWDSHDVAWGSDLETSLADIEQKAFDASASQPKKKPAKRKKNLIQYDSDNGSQGDEITNTRKDLSSPQKSKAELEQTRKKRLKTIFD